MGENSSQGFFHDLFFNVYNCSRSESIWLPIQFIKVDSESTWSSWMLLKTSHPDRTEWKQPGRGQCRDELRLQLHFQIPICYSHIGLWSVDPWVLSMNQRWVLPGAEKSHWHHCQNYRFMDKNIWLVLFYTVGIGVDL